MVLLGMLSGLKTKDPLDMGPMLFKRLRIEGSPPAWGRPLSDCSRDHGSTGTTLRSRSLEYQSNLLQEFQKHAMDKVFARCGASEGEGLDLVIHKVRFTMHLLSISIPPLISHLRCTPGGTSSMRTRRWRLRRMSVLH